jgi:hypothetical protein
MHKCLLPRMKIIILLALLSLTTSIPIPGLFSNLALNFLTPKPHTPTTPIEEYFAPRLKILYRKLDCSISTRKSLQKRLFRSRSRSKTKVIKALDLNALEVDELEKMIASIEFLIERLK